MLSRRLYNAVLYEDGVLVGGKSIDIASNGTIISVDDYKDGDYDCKNKVVIPAFSDGYVNLPSVDAYRMFSVDLSPYNVLSAYLERVGKESKTVKGFGWNSLVLGNEGAIELKQLLDKKFPDNPSYIYSDDMSCLLVNDAFLKVVSQYFTVSEETYQNGLLSSVCIELVYHYTELLDMPDDMLEIALLSFQEKLLSYGITTVRVCNIHADKNVWRVIKNLVKEGSWHILVLGYVHVSPFDTLEEMKALYRGAHACNNKYLIVQGISIDLDGSIDTEQAALFKPYEETAYCGNVFWRFKQLCDTVTAFNDVSVNISAYGDRAVATALRCYEKVSEEHGIKYNKTLSHCYLISASDVDRCSKLGVSVCAEPGLIPFAGSFYDSDIEKLGTERALVQYRFGTLISNAVKVFSGNTMQTGGPLKAVFNACKRTGPEDVTSYMALSTFIDNAYSVHNLQYMYGHIQQGYYASLIVVNKDVYNMREDKLCDAEVLATFVDGELVWER